MEKAIRAFVIRAVAMLLLDAYNLAFGAADHLPRTRETYLGTLVVWERIHPGLDVTAITNATLSQFKNNLVDGGLKRATVNRHLRSVLAILNRIGPPTARRPEALGLLPSVPFTTKCREPLPNVRTYSLEQVDALFRACEVATWPRKSTTGLAPALWWRAWIAVIFNTGLRRNEAVALSCDDVDWRTGTLIVRRAKGGDNQQIALNATALAALDAIRFPARERWFPLPSNYTKALYRWQKAIWRAAEVPPDMAFHDLRRTFGSLLYVRDPGAASKALRHSSVRVTESHYVQISAQTRAAVERLEQPSSFDVFGAARVAPPQLTLYRPDVG